MMRLRGLTWDHPRGYAPLEAASAEYARTYGVEVTWERRSLKDFGDAPIDALADAYDLVVIDHPHVGIAASCACFVPFDELLDATALERHASEGVGPSHDSYHYGGRQWALALDAAMQTSSHRPDLCPAPIPTTWTEVEDLARALRERDLYMAVPLVPTDAVCSFLTLCAQAGEPLREDGALDPDGAPREALATLRRLADLAHPDSPTWNPIDVYEAMSGRDDVAYCPIAFSYTNYARDGYRLHALRYEDLPGLRGSLLGGAGLAITTACRDPAAAAAFASWVCGAAVQAGTFTAAGGQPGNRAAWRDPRNDDLTNGFFRDTLRTLEHAYVRPRDAGFVAFQEYSGRRIHQFLMQETDPRHCLTDLARAFERRGRGDRS